MREIKFRGYDKNYKKWCYGSLIAGWDGQWYIEFYINRSLQKYRVDVDSIGQYTGFKDKNGREIYEGDTVKYCSHKLKVLFSEKIGQWLMYSDKRIAEYRLCNNLSMTEVVGNTYEEKLKERK